MVKRSLGISDSRVKKPSAKKPSAKEPAPKGWKYRTACENCREAKRRCNGCAGPRRCCTACKKKGTKCTFSPSNAGGCFIGGVKQHPPPDDAKVEIQPWEPDEEDLDDEEEVAEERQTPMPTMGMDPQLLEGLQGGTDGHGPFYTARPVPEPRLQDPAMQFEYGVGTGFVPLPQSHPYGIQSVFANGSANQAGPVSSPWSAPFSQQSGQPSPTVNGRPITSPSTFVGNGMTGPVIRRAAEQPYSLAQPASMNASGPQLSTRRYHARAQSYTAALSPLGNLTDMAADTADQFRFPNNFSAPSLSSHHHVPPQSPMAGCLNLGGHVDTTVGNAGQIPEQDFGDVFGKDWYDYASHIDAGEPGRGDSSGFS